ncbi:hypothetical protein GCM10009841_03490 [Microlunatus panaciterrae]|uniref:LPXTG-motif cell wall anchor domain-containing protein n=1 Tax=Microlunatus panaciterrae TaxID=400768 RepID=A0ABS2RLE3_9ACTN|nr:hypothetical protein [Microlunatus panaciterrae]
MKLKTFVTVAAVAGGLAVIVRRRNRKALAEADLWSEATDRVASTG